MFSRGRLLLGLALLLALSSVVALDARSFRRLQASPASDVSNEGSGLFVSLRSSLDSFKSGLNRADFLFKSVPKDFNAKDSRYYESMAMLGVPSLCISVFFFCIAIVLLCCRCCACCRRDKGGSYSYCHRLLLKFALFIFLAIGALFLALSWLGTAALHSGAVALPARIKAGPEAMKISWTSASAPLSDLYSRGKLGTDPALYNSSIASSLDSVAVTATTAADWIEKWEPTRYSFTLILFIFVIFAGAWTFFSIFFSKGFLAFLAAFFSCLAVTCCLIFFAPYLPLAVSASDACYAIKDFTAAVAANKGDVTTLYDNVIVRPSYNVSISSIMPCPYTTLLAPYSDLTSSRDSSLDSTNNQLAAYGVSVTLQNVTAVVADSQYSDSVRTSAKDTVSLRDAADTLRQLATCEFQSKMLIDINRPLCLNVKDGADYIFLGCLIMAVAFFFLTILNCLGQSRFDKDNFSENKSSSLKDDWTSMNKMMGSYYDKKDTRDLKGLKERVEKRQKEKKLLERKY